jgi:hypothetical protein
MMDFLNSEIRPVFDKCSPHPKQALLTIREWIFETAESSDEMGQIEECPKWGETNYVTQSPKSSTTLRLSQRKSNPSEYGFFVHCKTTLIEEFHVVYSDLNYDNNRGMLFDSREQIQTNTIKQFIYLALTYHRRKY